jgi:hypothetical protein
MSTFLLVPLNEQGAFTDTNVVQALQDAAASADTFSDVYLFSHGWWTNAYRAMVDYDRFVAGFDRALGTDPVARVLTKQPTEAFISAGVHWPSVLTEDPGSPLNYLEASSYFTMGERADDVGANGGYAILQSSVADRVKRVNLIGHSFGCRVVCSALTKFLHHTSSSFAQIRFNVVLLEAAYDQARLAPQGDYEPLLKDRRVRLLITRSAKDWSLSSAYPVANLVWDVVNHAGFASVATNLPVILEAAIGAKLEPIQIAERIATLFVHAQAARPDQQPPLTKRLTDVVTSRFDTLKSEAVDNAMRLVQEAATTLGHDTPKALGAEGPLPHVTAASGASPMPLALNANWPGTPPTPSAAAASPAPAQIEAAATALSGDFIVADLTGLHASREPVAWPGKDHHSDINAPETYRLIAGGSVRVACLDVRYGSHMARGGRVRHAEIAATHAAAADLPRTAGPCAIRPGHRGYPTRNLRALCAYRRHRAARLQATQRQAARIATAGPTGLISF